MVETSEIKELESSCPAVTIILQRHGQFDRTSGRVTGQGIEETRKITRQKVDQILASTSRPITFFILNSPSVWFGRGKRAEGTARAVAEEVKETIEQGAGMVTLHLFDKSIEGTRAHEKLEEINYAESSEDDIAERFKYLMRVIDRYAKAYVRQHSGRTLVFWLVTHGDVIPSFLQHGMGAKEGIVDYLPGLSEAVDLTLENGLLTTSFKGKEYNVEL